MRTLAILVLIAALSGCTNRKVFYLEDVQSHQTLSFFKFRNNEGETYTIVAYGKVVSNELPQSFLRVKDRWKDGWKLLIRWENDTAYIYEPYNVFEEVNVDSVPIKYIKMKDKEFYSIFYDESDSTYIKVDNLEIDKIL